MIVEYTPVDRLREYREQESDGAPKYDLTHRIVGPASVFPDHNAIKFKERWKTREQPLVLLRLGG